MPSLRVPVTLIGLTAVVVTHFFHVDLATELFFLEDDSGKVTGLEFVTQRGQHLVNRDS
jgi:hypothetical protein